MKAASSAFFAVFLTLFLPLTAHAKPGATADLINAQGKKVGKAVFSDSAQGLLLSLDVQGLPPGIHAMHIHDTGQCDPPQFKSAGPHFNPDGKKHGVQNPEGYHAGDLPNVAVGGHGIGKLNALLPELTLSKGPHAILKPGGTSLVIHASPDDGKTDPSGNSGDRIACGVIK